MKIKQIIALGGAVLLLSLYGAAIVFAFMKSPLAQNFLIAAIFCTMAIPFLIYAIQIAVQHISGSKQDSDDSQTYGDKN